MTLLRPEIGWSCSRVVVRVDEGRSLVYIPYAYQIDSARRWAGMVRAKGVVMETQTANTRNYIACLLQLHENTAQLVTSLLRRNSLSKSDKFQLAALPLITREFALACGIDPKDHEPRLKLLESRANRILVDLHRRVVALVADKMSGELDVTMITYQIEVQALHEIALELCAYVGR